MKHVSALFSHLLYGYMFFKIFLVKFICAFYISPILVRHIAYNKLIRSRTIFVDLYKCRIFSLRSRPFLVSFLLGTKIILT
jgi:hypothetical protein